ncbi:RHS repeat-associated core domain-containing protein [Pseudomonas sp. MDT1-17]
MNSIHRQTPTLNVNDSRGLPVRQVAYLRTVAGEAVETLITLLQHDAAGHLVAQRDPRLPTPNITSLYDLYGEPLLVDSVDAGWRLNLPGVAGQALERWDARGSHWRTTYDDQLRVVAVEENAQPDIETFTYANASADAGHNLRGQLLEQKDPSGSLRLDSYGLLGSPLRETRTFHDGKAFPGSRTYNALGAVLEQIDAGAHRQQTRYDLAGQLNQAQLQLQGQTDWQPVLVDAQYNAAGQIIEQRAGNNVLSRWSYDPADGRLSTQHSQKNAEAALQSFEYFYDRVGNITRILDHTFTPVFFANQRVDGHRDFTYDSLYRLTSASGYDDAPPSDIPGLPQPTDPNDRRNYTQTNGYDHGGNLIELRHAREGASHTRQMLIDPASNRGVRWKPGDPEPQFDRLFDRHGNLLALQLGQDLHWNARDQLEWVTLVERDGSDNDEEHYRYSQGERVYKRNETHTTKISHFHEVRYLPGLEVRTRDNGEELHVITLAGARCLHWVTGKPAGIVNDQLRYTLDDHLGSCVMELDQQAQLISHEGYYPFGATAWMAARSLIEVNYKFIRYSGKEMDVSGLYYYGARYYAPWLQRWISADPAGDVDGLNLYAFVGNNPIVFTDSNGQSLDHFLNGFLESPQQRVERKAQSGAKQQARRARSVLNQAVYKHTKVVGLSARRAKDAQGQILNHRSASALGSSVAIRTAAHVGGQAISYAAGIGIGIGTTALAAATGPVGVAVGFAAGMATKKAVSFGLDWASERAGLSASVKLKSAKLDPQRILNRGEYKTMDLVPYASAKVQGLVKGVMDMNQKGLLKGGKEGGNMAASVTLKTTGTPLASEISGVISALTGVPEIVHEVTGASADLTPEKIAKLDSNINGLIGILQDSMKNVEGLFAANGTDAINTFSVIPSKLHTASGDTVASLAQMTNSTIHELRYTQTLLHSRSSKVTAV